MKPYRSWLSRPFSGKKELSKLSGCSSHSYPVYLGCVLGVNPPLQLTVISLPFLVGQRNRLFSFLRTRFCRADKGQFSFLSSVAAVRVYWVFNHTLTFWWTYRAIVDIHSTILRVVVIGECRADPETFISPYDKFLMLGKKQKCKVACLFAYLGG